MFTLLQEELNCLKLASHASLLNYPISSEPLHATLVALLTNTAGPRLVNMTLQEFILMFVEPIDSTGFDVTGITV